MKHKIPFLILLCLFLGSSHVQAVDVALTPLIGKRGEVITVEYRSGAKTVGLAPDSSPAGIGLRLPNEVFKPLQFHQKNKQGKAIILSVAKYGDLNFRLILEQITPNLIQRTLEVTAIKAGKFAAKFDFFPAMDGEYSSFTKIENEKILYDTYGGSPEYKTTKGQTFPVAMMKSNDRVYGVIADSPGQWENRCLVLIDPTNKQLSVMNGDGRDPYELKITYDEPGAYTYQMDGWQSLAAGETRKYTSWVFAENATNHYQSQLAAHLALANGKGWNNSAIEAIMRNTSYYLMRRNLMRTESKYIFISGIGYGWKQWVSDGFYASVVMNEPEKIAEAYRGVFEKRIGYEDNAQYYLFWSALAKRAGGKLNDELVKKSFAFIRKHEKNGIYYPPPVPNADPPTGFKTYMDKLPYDNDDAPSSNQGFHCGALMAAQELGLGVTEEDIQRAITGFRSMYNDKLKFMPTSLKKQEILGQDTLYGEAVTYAIFGRKLLTDEQVQGHLRTTLKVMSPYGMRVISKADGSLLEGHDGHYVWGGSWFLCDAANYLVGELHGVPKAEIDQHLIDRIAIELQTVPAFNECINTVTGKPYGHILYSWNSGYWWLRNEFRKRLKQTGIDPVAEAVDRKLNVVRDRKNGLRINND